MKTCFKCKQLKELDMFYRHPGMTDGHLNKCKECAKAETKKRHNEKSNDIEWREKELERHRAKSRRYREMGAAVNQESLKKSLFKWRLNNKDKIAAQYKVSNAIRSGKLKRKPCEICGDIISQAHHDNYKKPLDVRWLCVTHHNEHHVMMRRLERQTMLNIND